MQSSFSTMGVRPLVVRAKVFAGVTACLVFGPLCAMAQSPDCRRGLDSEGAAVTGVGVGDFDGDGDFDVLVSASRDFTGVGVWSEQISPLCFVHHRSGFPVKARILGAADFNGDGRDDYLIKGNEGASSILACVGPQPCEKRAFTISMPGGMHAAFTVDMDADGDTDVVSGDFNTGIVAWHENNGASSPAFARHVIDADLEGLGLMRVGLVNDDPYPDITLSTARPFWPVASFLYTQTGAYPPEFEIESLPNGVGVICDIDKDGDADLIGSPKRWLESSGGADPIFTQRSQPELSNTTLWNYAMDCDADGDLDFVGLYRFQTDDRYMLIWSENLGVTPLRFRERLVLDVPYGHSEGRGILAVDIDQDGAGEIISWRNVTQPRTTWSGGVGIYENLTRFGTNSIPASHWQLFP